MVDPHLESLGKIKIMFGTDVLRWRLPSDSNALELGPEGRMPTTTVLLDSAQAQEVRTMGGMTSTVVLDVKVFAEPFTLQLLGKKVAGMWWGGSATPIAKHVSNVDPLVMALSFAELVISEVNCVVAIIDNHGRIQRFNRLAEEVSGMKERDVIGMNAFDLLMSENDGRNSRARVGEFFKTGQTYDVERTIQTIKGPRLFQIRNKFLRTGTQPDQTFLICSGVDITEEREIQKRLVHAANSDALTGLGNRNHLTALLAREIADEKAIKRLALLFIDLNNFKRINDSLGHQYGDQLLKKVAQRLQQVVCGAHEIMRVSGDEFVIVVCGENAAQAATELARQIIVELDFSFVLHANSYKIKASIGLVEHETFGDSEYNLMTRADLAMYEAKAAGRRKDVSTLYTYTPELSARSERGWEQHQALQAGFLRKEFEIDFRLFHKLDGEGCGVSATVTWNKPGAGLVSAEEFLPMVESSAFGIQMGEFILREIAVQAQEKARPEFQKDCSYFVMSVPEAQFQDGDLEGFISECTREYALDPSSLYLVMPSIFDKAPEPNIVEKLHRLRDLGVKIILKITEKSPFPNIVSLPVDGMLLDREFTARVPTDATACAIFKGLIGLCIDTGLKVLVEGVIEKNQLKWFSQFPNIDIDGPLHVPLSAAGDSAEN